jgi:hypothetical protein
MNDITIIFLTANKLPKKWALYQKEKLLEAAPNTPIITLSREPLDWGTNMLQTEAYGQSNIWFQLLKGAKAATTKFIAVAEDDVLYPKEHFEFRPTEDLFAYNKNRFNLFAWGTPTYSWKERMGNFTLIAPRKLLIEALEERFRKYPKGTPAGMTGEIGKYEAKMGLTRPKCIWFETGISVVHIDHEYGLDQLSHAHRKRRGILQSYDIPYWGEARELVNKFKDE